MREINNILNKYFEGETTTEEERLLAKYFQSKSVATEHEIYRPLFQHFALEKEKLSKKPRKRGRILWLAIASCAAVFAGFILFNALPEQPSHMQTVAYVNGERTEDMNIIRAEVLNSLEDIEEDTNNNIMKSQIDVLDFFIKKTDIK